MSNTNVYLGRHDRVGDLPLVASGKVRDIYDVDEQRLLFVTTDRVSAFDVLMPCGIPHKGRVLTSIAAHWFERTRDVCPNHLLSTDPAEVPGLDASERTALNGRIMLVKKLQPTPIEWVVRGYLMGSGWKSYQANGSVCGVALPAGLRFCEKLPEPIFTPTTKDEHDEPISAERAAETVGQGVFERALQVSMELFARGTETLEPAGILLADTKFEFGIEPASGELYLIDEALTPDSSRFLPADAYRVGENPPSYDKQILRDWLESTDWNKKPPAPDLPPDLVRRITERYLEVCELITGHAPVGVTA